MSVQVILRCIECPQTTYVKPYSLMTKLGTLRVQADSKGWQVNGIGALCPDCKPEPDQWQNESWLEYDRTSVIRQLIDEGEPTVIEPSPEKKAVAEALRNYT